jgi:hypothetical protein
VSTERALPQNLDAERALLGSALLDNEVLTFVQGKLSPDDFYGAGHRVVFRVMLEMRASGLPLDEVSLCEELKARGELEKAGGVARISSFTDLVPVGDLTFARNYARIIKEKSDARRLINLAQNLAARAYDGEPHEIAASLTADLEVIGRNGQNIPGVRASDVKPEEVNWLWRGYIARREITLAVGNKGLGKSTLTLDLSARITRGWRMPDGSGPQVEPSGVVIVTTEDTISTTVVPRLIAAGADLKRIRAIPDVFGEVPELSKHERQIEAAICDVEASLLIVDPLVVGLDSKVDTHKNADVRRNLATVKRLAERAGIAVLGLGHLTKAAGGDPLYRVQGSIAFTAVARSVLLAAKDPEDPAQYVLAVVACNLAALAASLRYRLTPASEIPGIATVSWEGESAHKATDLIADGGEDERGAKEEAKEFLRHLLGTGEVPSQEVFRLAKRESISERTLWRAKKDLGVKWRREGYGRDAKYFWLLPDSAKNAS